MTDEQKLLEAQISDQAKSLRAAQERLEAIKVADEEKRLEPLKATAERAHDLLCPYNHTDGCSWGYERDSWTGQAHSRWLRKINLLVNGTSYEKPTTTLSEVNVVLDAVETLKPKVRTALDLIRRGLVA